jgi:hypothetical protein
MTSTIPEDAACGSTRSYAAIATDSLGQTASATKSVTVTCTTSPGPGTQDDDEDQSPAPQSQSQSQTQGNVTPAAVLGPTVAWRSWPSPLRGSGVVTFAPNAPAGLKSVAVYLGNRRVCTVTGAPYSCRITVSGADVGGQSLRLVITDARGATAETARSIVVAKFRAKMKLSVKTKALRRGFMRRTLSGRVSFPGAVTKRQGCKGTVTLVVKRGGHSVLNQQVRVSKGCTFSRSLTAKRSRQSFTAKARFGGNAVLASADGTRRFS